MPAGWRTRRVGKQVERLWPGSTVVCIASGPSLTQDDCDYVRGKARVIVVNTSYERAPWADALYACDDVWWRWQHEFDKLTRKPRWHPRRPAFEGLKFAMDKNAARWPGVTVLKNLGPDGLSLDPRGLKHGKNSGYAAIGLAVLLGASRVVLLGYDMQRGPKGEEHWHPNHLQHRDNPFPQFLRLYGTLVEPLKAAGVEVVNCSRRSALRCFPMSDLKTEFSRDCVELAS